MQFTVKRSDLLNELNLAIGVVEKKHTIPILANIVMDISRDSIGIMATDQDLGIRCGCGAEATDIGATTVPSKKIFDIVRLLPETEIHFLMGEDNWMEIKCQNSTFKIACLPKDNYPGVPEYEGERISIPAAAFRSMILRTIFSITQEESRYALNGALTILGPSSMKMVTTDGHRLAYIRKEVELQGGDRENRVLIPRKTLGELLKMIDDQLTVEMGRDDRHLFFKIGSRELISGILAGQFPNFEMVLPKGNDQILICNTALLNEGLRRAVIMADETSRSIKFRMSHDKLELKAATADQGESLETLDVEYQGEPMQLGLNAQYVMDFLSAAGSEKISMEMKDEESQVLFRPQGEQDFDYCYVVMPIQA